MKILVIDDNVADIELIKAYLAQEGYSDIISSTSAEKAIGLFKQEKPDVVLTDTNMPIMNGFEVCKAIKSIEEIKTWVIIMTGAVDAIDALKARKHGADDYCAKTFECEDIIESLKNIVKMEEK